MLYQSINTFTLTIEKSNEAKRARQAHAMLPGLSLANTWRVKLRNIVFI